MSFLSYFVDTVGGPATFIDTNPRPTMENTTETNRPNPMRPATPADLSRVSTWTSEQMAWAAPRISALAAAAASETTAEARECRAAGNLEAYADLSKIAARYLATAAFWSQVQAGDRPNVPAFLNASFVSAYEQTNGRVRRPKTRNPGPKDWGVFNA